MNGILSADGVSILSRYMAAMTAATGPTAASLPNNGSDADIETSHLGVAVWSNWPSRGERIE
jgi:hypothetical protein